MSRLFIIGFIAAFALFFLLVVVATRVSVVANYYSWLFWANIAVIAALGLATLHRLFNLWRYIRRQESGSRLARRLFVTLSTVSIVSSLVVYGLSYRFLDTSIESWFQLEIDKAVQQGLDLARTVRLQESKQLEVAANALAQNLSPMSPPERRLEIAKWREILAVESITLFDENRQSQGQSTSERYSLSIDVPETINIGEIGFRAMSRVDGDSLVASSKAPKIRVLVRIPTNDPLANLSMGNDHFSLGSASSTLRPTALFMQIVKITPEHIQSSLHELASAYQHYGELKQGRGALKKLFLTALTMLFVLTLITALWLALVFSQRFVKPLAILVKATHAAARGDFSHRLVEGNTQHDEFDQLIVSFNDMLADLKSAQESAGLAQKEMAESRAFLADVLNHLNAGVLIVGSAKERPAATALPIDEVVLLSVNSAAHRLIGEDLMPLVEVPIVRWGERLPILRAFCDFLSQQIARQALSSDSSDPIANPQQEWTHNIELRLAHGYRTMIVRGTHLPNAERWVIVFDDITEHLRAQHLAIWSEMARRLAHEIKNPLTPIQLSAERLQRKVSDKLPENERDILERSIGTIVSQVDAIKTLVNQFREMARPASTNLEVFRVNDLIQEVAELYDEKRIAIHLPRKKYKVFADRHQLRQVFHNLILNAEQANHQRLQDWERSRVYLTLMEGSMQQPPFGPIASLNVSAGQTKVLRLDKIDDSPHPPTPPLPNVTASGVWMVVCDIGGGFAEAIIDRAFEPNVTSKIKGSGLGLSIVRKIIEEHHGNIRLYNDTWIGGDPDHQWDNVSQAGEIVRGAVVMVWLPLAENI